MDHIHCPKIEQVIGHNAYILVGSWNMFPILRIELAVETFLETSIMHDECSPLEKTKVSWLYRYVLESWSFPIPGSPLYYYT